MGLESSIRADRWRHYSRRHGHGLGEGEFEHQGAGSQATSVGAQLTATVQILNAATSGTRLVRLRQAKPTFVGMMFNSVLTVTKHSVRRLGSGWDERA